MIAARYIARSLAEYGRPELRTAVRLAAAGGNPHRIVRRYGLTDREAAGLPALVAAVRDAGAVLDAGSPSGAHGHTGPDDGRLA